MEHGQGQPAIRLVAAKQQRPEQRPGALGIRPADDDELGPIEALAFDPGAAIAGQIGAIELLRGDALEAMLACRPAKRFAIAAFMIATGLTAPRACRERKTIPRDPLLREKSSVYR